MLAPLPIYSLLPSVVEAVAKRGALVLEAAPGAGKTTRVPGALLDAGARRRDRRAPAAAARGPARRAPRRRGARRAGRRRVGYQMRFEEVPPPRRASASSPRACSRAGCSPIPSCAASARGARRVPRAAPHGDLALALLRAAARGARPELKLVVMSATLDAEPVAAFLGDAPRVALRGPRDSRWRSSTSTARRRSRRSAAGRRARCGALVARRLDGDVLVFLPGAARDPPRARGLRRGRARARPARLPLHGDLTADEQDRAVRPAQAAQGDPLDQRRRDLGDDRRRRRGDRQRPRARRAHSPWSGLPSLQVGQISARLATQRAGPRGPHARRAAACASTPRRDFTTRAARSTRPRSRGRSRRDGARAARRRRRRTRRASLVRAAARPPRSRPPRSCSSGSARSPPTERSPRLGRRMLSLPGAPAPRAHAGRGGAARRRRPRPPRAAAVLVGARPTRASADAGRAADAATAPSDRP